MRVSPLHSLKCGYSFAKIMALLVCSEFYYALVRAKKARSISQQFSGNGTDMNCGSMYVLCTKCNKEMVGFGMMLFLLIWSADTWPNLSPIRRFTMCDQKNLMWQGGVVWKIDCSQVGFGTAACLAVAADVGSGASNVIDWLGVWSGPRLFLAQN